MRILILHITICLAHMAAVTSSPLALSNAQDSQARYSQIIDRAIQAVSEAQTQRQLQAPEAARLYALTAIGLHDSYHIARGKPGFIAKDEAPHSPDALELMGEVSHIILTQSLGQPLPEATSLAHYIAEHIVEHLPLPQSETLLLSGDWLPDGAPVLSHWKNAAPLLLTSASQFRPSGPPLQSSDTYISALERLTHTPTQSEAQTAHFWSDPEFSAPALWNAIALEQLRSADTETGSQLQTLLALNIALYDTSIAAWETKYHYQSARPVAVINDQSWSPLVQTPHHPEYISDTAAFSAAAASILTQALGAKPFCISASSPPIDKVSTPRCFDDFNAAALEAAQSGVIAGLHFDFSSADGITLGQSTAQHTGQNLE